MAVLKRLVLEPGAGVTDVSPQVGSNGVGVEVGKLVGVGVELDVGEEVS
jgi:hypothetical protein